MKRILFIITIATICQVQAQIPTDNLDAYYPFNGNANDASANSNNGVVNGASLTADRFGNTNSAYHFDGTDDWINLGNDASLHYEESTISSISLWFNCNTNAKQNLLRYDDKDDSDADSPSSRNILMLRIDNLDADMDFDIRYSFGNVSGTRHISFHTSNDYSLSSWHHLVAMKDNVKDSVYLYMNGIQILAEKDVSSGTWETTGQFMMMGRFKDGGTGEFFSGEIDDVRLYSDILTDCEILSLFREGTGLGIFDLGISQIGNTLISNDTNATYQWFDCNNNTIIPGDTNQTFTITSSGNYAVILNIGDCSDTSTCISTSKSWNCINGACIDPGNGSGIYSDSASCALVCATTPSWDCINGACIDPGTGFGTFSSYSSCINTCVTSNLNAFIYGNDTICDNIPGAAEIKITFSNVTASYTFIYAIDGISQPSITTSINPYIINTSKEGTYTLVSVLDINGYGSISGQAFVTLREAPTAHFTTVSDTINILHPTLQLNDASLGNITDWTWDFGDNSPNNFTRNPYHEYADSLGVYQISLVVQDNFGCSDTTFKQLWVADKYWMYIPNSFTPDLDGKNDKFCISYNGVRIETFYFNVYNRGSNLVYTTNNINELECFLNENGWDGKHYETENDLPMGVYVYEIYFQDFEEWKHQEMGHLFIIR